MEIPKSFKDNIKKVFYDKDVNVLRSVSITDSEGGTILSGTEITDTLKGNTRFTDFEAIQNTYGLDYKIDVVITTDYDTLIVGNLIEIDQIKYIARDVLKRDSHYMIVGDLWQK